MNTRLTQCRQLVGTFSSSEAAGQALDQLVLSGFPIAQTFLLGRDLKQLDASVPVYGTLSGTTLGLKRGIVLGNLVGGTTGLLLGVGLIALPGVGPLMLSSAIAFTLLSGGVCTAAGGLIGAFIGLGLTEEQAKAYSQQVARGSILLIVEGTPQEIVRARHLLKTAV
jgi:hypothetical protein